MGVLEVYMDVRVEFYMYTLGRQKGYYDVACTNKGISLMLQSDQEKNARCN